jgi:hypothetical protein
MDTFKKRLGGVIAKQKINILVLFIVAARPDVSTEDLNRYDALVVFYPGDVSNLSNIRQFSFKLNEFNTDIEDGTLTRDALQQFIHFLSTSSSSTQLKNFIGAQHVCHVCNAAEADKVCSMCGATRYCSVKCQLKDWSAHTCSKNW